MVFLLVEIGLAHSTRRADANAAGLLRFRSSAYAVADRER
jgi:hypothetical protein